MPLPEKDKDDGTFNLNDLGYDLPDLWGVCGGAPTDEETVLRTPSFFFKQHGDCSCTEAPPDEPIGHDYHRELHEYLVEKGEREE